jgi:hypothetical protein
MVEFHLKFAPLKGAVTIVAVVLGYQEELAEERDKFGLF